MLVFGRVYELFESLLKDKTAKKKTPEDPEASHGIFHLQLCRGKPQDASLNKLRFSPFFLVASHRERIMPRPRSRMPRRQSNVQRS